MSQEKLETIIQHMGILSAHARKESNFMNSAPFVILNALPAGF